MKPALLLPAIWSLLGLCLAGCAGVHARMPQRATASVAPVPARGAQAEDGAAIQKIPFHLGVSSATVERMARGQACSGGPGAGLITQTGPVEVYRMQCDDGRVFMARCEMRQCRKM